MRPLWFLSLLLPLPLVADEPPIRLLPPDQPSADARLARAVTLNDYFPFTPPTTREAWEQRRSQLREQLLVSQGLWPLPEKTPLNPVIHGLIERDEYTIENVFFASLPGHYVSGNLYRPRGKSGKLPAVLCPHGHWNNGRFYDAGEKNAQAQIDKGAEKTMEGARFPLQARCAMLARMGCVVFHYDMVGVADSTAIGHTAGFTDAQAELWGQNFMGLQTWNSIRALDFLCELPDVDPKRIGVTGASGGGTQTFMLGALDDRPAVAFPAVMVSTSMQGGCICENASWLRVGTGNVEFAAMFAPKPLAMTAADDWTKEIETKGLPELKALYKLYDAEENVTAKYFPFEHNYNQVSREMMYHWFNKHLNLGYPEPIVEKPFEPVPPKNLSVYDNIHPRPNDTTDAQGVRKWFTAQSERQLAAMTANEFANSAEFRRIVGTTLRVMVGTVPTRNELVLHQPPKKEQYGGFMVHRTIFGRKGVGDRIPSIGLIPSNAGRTIALWIHPQGKAGLFDGNEVAAPVKALLAKGVSVMAPDVLLTGEQVGQGRPIDQRYAGYTFGYNRPPLAEQVRDILASIGWAKTVVGAEKILLVGWGDLGPATALARAACGDEVDRTAIDLDQFRFESVATTSDPRLLPTALKYGGLAAFLALAAPGELLLSNHADSQIGKLTAAAYKAAGAADKLRREPQRLTPEQVVDWLIH